MAAAAADGIPGGSVRGFPRGRSPPPPAPAFTALLIAFVKPKFVGGGGGVFEISVPAFGEYETLPPELPPLPPPLPLMVVGGADRPAAAPAPELRFVVICGGGTDCNRLSVIGCDAAAEASAVFVALARASAT